MNIPVFLSTLVGALLIAGPAFGLETARMQLPADFEPRADRLEASGFGGRNKGEYRLAEYSGEFTRGESRLALLNAAYVSNKGKSSFTLRDEHSDDILSAECEMKKKTVNVDAVTIDPKKMAYHCDFRRGGELMGARLVIGQPKAKGFAEKFVAKDARRGESTVFDQHLAIESVHNYKGSKLASSAPTGYLLNRGDETVAAIELTDVNPVVFIATGLADDLRLSAITTALAIAVLRDPANSALED